MKKIFSKIFIVFCAAILFAACKKDGTLTYLDVVKYPAGAFTASTDSIILNTGNNDSSALTFSWPAVTFKIKAAVTYSLQLDIPSDTIGVTAWANAYTILVGDDVLSKSFTGNGLNVIALTKLGLTKDSMNTVVARVVAVMDRSVYSNAVSVKVQPFKVYVKSVLYLPGDYQGWSPATATKIAEVTGQPKRFEGYVYIPTGGSYQFKMTPQADWTPTAYGDATGNSGTVIVANYAGGNMTVPTGGYYEITVDLNTNKWTATNTTWGIIGDATPGSWGASTEMTYDPVNQVWVVTAPLTVGNMKFRANDAWHIDFGVDSNNVLQYADNPFFPYNNLPAISITTAGNYTITLDLHNSGNYTYTLKMN